jgi:hypothetical protein
MIRRAHDWRGDGDTPRVTAKVLKWYRLRLPAVFHRKDGGPLAPARLAELVDWYAERPDEFLIWKAEEEYRGARYNMGLWCLNTATINEALPRASREIEAEKRRRAYAERGPVTEADVDAAIARLEGSAPLTEEADGIRLVIPERQGAYLCHKYNVRDYWPRPCQRCGQEYKPAKRSQRVTCPDCLAKAKAERAQAKQRP